ncbi:MAG: hypothetical protein NVSMB14_04710 [Isosphaeraceae bacterium]
MPREPEPEDQEDVAGAYDLADPVPATENDIAPRLDDEFAPPPRVAPRPEKKRVRDAEDVDDMEGESTYQPDSRVDEVWSRWAEWKTNLIALAVAAAVTWFGVFYIKAAIFLPLGILAMLILSYPLAVTLERPVRVTPEQAAKDYYGALSHFWPHYRRMWLLLSTTGRTSNQFRSYVEFKNYWKLKLAALQGGKAKFLNPLIFEVETFKGEKSVGKSTVDAKFTVAARLRGKPDEAPIEVSRVTTGLVRGPDNMWYLDQGTLPGRQV